MLSKFPFATELDRENYLRALVTPMVRDYIDGPIPLIVITADSPGCGKTFLGTTMQYVNDCDYGVMNFPNNDRELSLILSGNYPVALLDNINSKRINASELLPCIVASNSLTYRKLYHSDVTRIDFRSIIVITVNGEVSLSQDLLRRSVIINLTHNQKNHWTQWNARELAEELKDEIKAKVAAWTPTGVHGDWHAVTNSVLGL